jgi:toxin YoeB
MKIALTPDGWSDFTHWIETDRKKLNRLVRLIKETSRNPFTGLGEPEPLRRRLVVPPHRQGTSLGLPRHHPKWLAVLEIAQCRYHY